MLFRLGVRLDELVSTVEDIAVLGIQVGDWVEVNLTYM